MNKVPFPKTPLKTGLDFLGFPIRSAVLNDQWTENLGFTSLQQERINAVWPFLKGRVLDVGAGENRLIRLYGNGLGVDLYPLGKDVVAIQDSAHLPFNDNEFDTVCYLACLNHIPNRAEALKEGFRVLKPRGRCLLTMINPLSGILAHKFSWHDESRKRGGMHEGEELGLWNHTVVRLLENAGFRLERHRYFLYGLNNLFVGVK